MEFTILTPYPGTPIWHRMVKEDRILHRAWTRDNDANVVFRPAQMSPERLQEGYLHRWREFYRPRQALRALDRCAPPRVCEASADGEACTMRFYREVPLWVTPWTPPQGTDALIEARRQLCIRVEPGQGCLWAFDLPPGEYTADAPFPTRYTGSYECGGRTCNGVDAL